MITPGELITIANERLSDAEALYMAGRYDAAAYLCGYAIEISLKHKICVTLNWTEFPKTSAEFKNYTCLKTHDLDVLLSFVALKHKLNRHTLKTGQCLMSGRRNQGIIKKKLPVLLLNI